MVKRADRHGHAVRMNAFSIFVSPQAAAREVLSALRGVGGDGRPAKLPIGAWALFAAIAVVGSFAYGASVARVVPGWDIVRGGLWVVISTAPAWPILGLGLIRMTRTPLWFCFHACLVTMTYGIAILLTGAGLNWMLGTSGVFERVDPARYNYAVVGVSNVVMALVLAEQMAMAGIGWLRTIAIWMVCLNGSGAFLFWFFHRVLFT